MKPGRTAAEFLSEYASFQRDKPEPPPAFVPPTPRGLQPEVVCPLCQGLGALAASRREHYVTSNPKRTCVLCEGHRTIFDRSSELPASRRRF